MIEFSYELSKPYITEIIRDKLIDRKNAIKANSNKKQITTKDKRNIEYINVVLKDYILDYETDDNLKFTCRQNKTRESWDEVFNKHQIKYNEALCTIFGVNPSASDLLDNDIYKITNEQLLFDNSLSHIFYSRPENSLLMSRFRNKEYINTKDFILWAIKQNLIVQKPVTKNTTGTKKRTKTLVQQDKINTIARNIVIHSPNISKNELSRYISDELSSKYNINLKPSAIYKRYMDTHPIY